MKFECEVNQGATMSNADLGHAISNIGLSIGETKAVGVQLSGVIRDSAGATVGKWRLAEPRTYKPRAPK